MKIHRVVTMLGATTTTGKLADDMYDLNYKAYYSEGEDRYIPISHMDFQHMVRAFVKLRQTIAEHKKLARKLSQIERRLSTHDSQITSLVHPLFQ